MELDLPKPLLDALTREARQAKKELGAHVVEKLESITPPARYVKPSVPLQHIGALAALVARLPAVHAVSHGVDKHSFWWVKLHIDIRDPLAWRVVQELGFVLNYISVEERLPTVFLPISPPPYLNGGPEEFLSWVVESKYGYIDPEQIVKVLEARLPSPVDDRAAWTIDDAPRRGGV